MRIISNYKDYYDGVAAYDQTGKVWTRQLFYGELPMFDAQGVMRSNNMKKISDDNGNIFDIPLSLDQLKYIAGIYDNRPRLADCFFDNRREHDKFVILGLCGKLYYIINAIEKDGLYNEKIVGVYTSFDDYLKSFDGKFRRFGGMAPNEWAWKYQNTKELKDLFYTLKTPIFALSYSRKVSGFGSNGTNLIINPCLKEYKIQSIIDPYTLYQELDMYINNDLVNIEDHILIRTDELIRDSKGFDKYSFRKSPTKKKYR